MPAMACYEKYKRGVRDCRKENVLPMSVFMVEKSGTVGIPFPDIGHESTIDMDY